MNLSEFKETLFHALLDVQGLRPPATTRGLGPPAETEVSEVILKNRELVEQLVAEAYKNGFVEPPEFCLETTQLFGGAVAQYVGRATTTTNFAVKLDKSHELAGQAVTLRHLREGEVIPPQYRSLFPKVYSALSEGPPFGYLMEFFGEGYTKLSDYLFCGKNSLPAGRVLTPLMEVIFGLFADTKQELLIPNLDAIYLKRIRERIDAAKTLDPIFRRMAGGSVSINSRVFGPYDVYAQEIARTLAGLGVGFSTFVHGDIHPGNIFYKSQDDHLDVKFIDPKPWVWGDYMFDVGKLLHYMQVTGPMEDAQSVRVTVEDAERPVVRYDIQRLPLVSESIEIVMTRLRQFAMSAGDSLFHRRLRLSLASNLLGLCENRLKKGLFDNAVLFYCEGLLHLADLAENRTE